MAAAFSHFEEPFAWLIRGLIEYGWPDISRPGSRIPPGAIGGIQLNELIQSGGARGIQLEVPARCGDQLCIEDGQYIFRVALIRDAGRTLLVVRSPEANYMQEFEFDATNPTWAAGYIHQALTEYIPAFVKWRLQGGELSWAERAGIPEVESESASPLLVSFVRERVQRQLSFDSGPQENWWPLESGNSGDQYWAGGAIARTGAGMGEPVFVRKKGQLRMSTVEEQRLRLEAIRKLDLPGSAMVWLSATHLMGGTVWFINGIYSWLADGIGDVELALQVSFSLAILAYGLGTASLLGARRYKRLIQHRLVNISLAFIGIMPLFYLWICLWLSWWMLMTIPIWIGGGIVVSVWAWRTWNAPMILQARALENPVD